MEIKPTCLTCGAYLTQEEIGSGGIYWTCPKGHGGFGETTYRFILQQMEAKNKAHELAKPWNHLPCPVRPKLYARSC